MTNGAASPSAGSIPPVQGAPARLQGLAPVVGVHTAVLVLGSFPGAASLRAQEYYAHPQNQFWRIMQALWPQHALPAASLYARRCDWLLQRRLGVWDVYASCLRSGSLDAAIREPEVNDFSALRRACPALAAVAHNGAESHRHARSVEQALAGVESVKLPSTSPANAAWSFERKLAAWADLMARHGLL